MIKKNTKAIMAIIAANDNVSVDGDITIKPRLSLKEKIGLVSETATQIYNPKTYAFFPETESFLCKLGVIQYYTNIKLPDDLEASYEILFETDLYSLISENINPNELVEIVDAINRRVDFEMQMSVKTDLNSFINTINGFNADDVMRKMSSIVTTSNAVDLSNPKIAKKMLSAIEGNNTNE